MLLARFIKKRAGTHRSLNHLPLLAFAPGGVQQEHILHPQLRCKYTADFDFSNLLKVFFYFFLKFFSNKKTIKTQFLISQVNSYFIKKLSVINYPLSVVLHFLFQPFWSISCDTRYPTAFHFMRYFRVVDSITPSFFSNVFKLADYFFINNIMIQIYAV